jgi:fused signal recognition particle receptor
VYTDIRKTSEDIFGETAVGIFRRGLSKTRQSFFGRIAQVLGNTQIDDDTWDDIEAMLIQADLGIETTTTVIEYLQEAVREEGLTRNDQLFRVLRESLGALLENPPELNLAGHDLSIILIVGVNGSGKTTSIAKLANLLHKQGRKVMLAAGDTFRAAAIEQLSTWGERIGVPVIKNQTGADPGAVVYDAINAAKARDMDVLIVDTAGRLHNNFNLMQELAKIQGVIKKAVPDAPHEILLVMDGTTGQNALRQGMYFDEAVTITGLIITKLDGTAKGGMVFSVFNDLNVPVHFIGLGEGLDDLQRFDKVKFIDSLFEDNAS